MSSPKPRPFWKSLGMAASFLLPVVLVAEEAKPPLNVLFIAVDDLRPELGAYGSDWIHSPNLDRLAGQGLIFDRAYCQQAICMASRASLLSGYRPDQGKLYENGALFDHIPDALTLNQHFLDNGYEAVTMGKIYHHSSDLDQGWSDSFRARGKWAGRGYLSAEGQRQVEEYRVANPDSKRRGMGPAFEAPDVPDAAYKDGVVAGHAIRELRRLKDKPFFMAIGFDKPHLPFNAPKKYWDLYDREKIRLPDNPFAPQGAPELALTNWGELRGYVGIPKKGPLPDDLARELIHGYYACVSYVDALIGTVLDELDRLGLAGNTVVVLWGDHGWKLGEHGMWAKHTNFELDTRVSLIIRAPGAAANGRRTAALTELVDIYPTLVELCGLAAPDHLQGTSFVPLLQDPDRPWKRAAFSQYPRGEAMGYSTRTDRYRYTEWRDLKDGTVMARELYDHQQDPQENTNVADDPGNAELILTLAGLLHGG